MRVIVDGRPVDVEAGSSVLAAVRATGADVPTLCHDDRLTPTGGCRVCLVATDAGGVVAACATPVTPGLAVRTDDPQVTELVRGVLALQASTLPVTARSQRSEFADLCERFDVGDDAFADVGAGLGRDDSHPYVKLDRDLCIACGRCVRMCDEVQGTFALTLVGRGSATVVEPGTGGAWEDSACVSCGGCVDSCPTGALFEPGAVLAPEQTTRTTCGYCGVGCTLDVHTRGDDVLTVTPALDGPVNRGHACVKGRFAHGFVRSGDRLTTPLVRENGQLRPAGWDEALGVVADRLRRIVAEHGPDAVAAISSARATNEENYLLQKFMRTVVGTNNIDNCSRICHSPSAAGLTAAFGLSGGTNPGDDIDTADCLLVAGSNATEAHPVVGARITQRVLQGAALVVVDPRRTELARLADVHLRGRPGSNVAVFNGLARLLLEEGFADDEFLRARADGLDELRAVLADYPPERVEAISGIAAADLVEAARLFGAAKRPSIIYGLGITEQLQGTAGVRTLSNLAILRGSVGTANGGGVNPLRGQNNVQGASDIGALPDLLPGYQRVTDAAARARFAEVWGVAPPGTPGLRIPDMFEAARNGRLRALYVFGENIVQTDPDADNVRAAVEACELVVSQEIFLSETAALADVVLPGAAYLEKDGTFVNFDRRFQRVRAALPPPGDARTDFDVINSLAVAMGADLGCPTPADALSECARVAPLFGGISSERLDREGALHWPCRSADDPGQPRLYEESFATPDGRAQLGAFHWQPPGEQPDAEYPLVLITGRRLVHYNAATMTRRTPNLALVPDERLDLHPVDAARLGLADGELAEVRSRRGSVRAAVRLTDAVAPGEVFLAFHFPEVAANVLTSAHVDGVTSCPEYKVTAVSVTAVVEPAPAPVLAAP